MKKLFPLIAFFGMFFTSYSQDSTLTVESTIENLRAINQLTISDIKSQIVNSPQFEIYSKLVLQASKEDLIKFSQDSNNVVKGFVLLALLEQKQDIAMELYSQTLLNKDFVISTVDSVESKYYLSDLLKAKAGERIDYYSQNYTDKIYFEKIYFKMDSISIMNIDWSDSEVTMDYIIKTDKAKNSDLLKRKNLVANSYFINKLEENNNDYSYGTECGNPASVPYLRGMLEKSMKDKSINRVAYFDKWISCDILVVKVYGIEALIRLNNEGKELTPLQIKTIQEYKRSYKSLQVCSKFYRERKPINMILGEFELLVDAEN